MGLPQLQRENPCFLPIQGLKTKLGHLFSIVIRSIKIISLKNSLAYQLIIT